MVVGQEVQEVQEVQETGTATVGEEAMDEYRDLDKSIDNLSECLGSWKEEWLRSKDLRSDETILVMGMLIGSANSVVATRNRLKDQGGLVERQQFSNSPEVGDAQSSNAGGFTSRRQGSPS